MYASPLFTIVLIDGRCICTDRSYAVHQQQFQIRLCLNIGTDIFHTSAIDEELQTAECIAHCCGVYPMCTMQADGIDMLPSLHQRRGVARRAMARGFAWAPQRAAAVHARRPRGCCRHGHSLRRGRGGYVPPRGSWPPNSIPCGSSSVCESLQNEFLACVLVLLKRSPTGVLHSAIKNCGIAPTQGYRTDPLAVYVHGFRAHMLDQNPPDVSDLTHSSSDRYPDVSVSSGSRRSHRNVSAKSSARHRALPVPGVLESM